MILGDPLLDHFHELFRVHHDLCCFSLGSNETLVIVNYVPLPPTSIEVIAVRFRSFANRELNDFKRNPVVPCAHDAVAGTRNRHFCRLQRSVICSCKTPVRRYSIQGCVSQVAGNDGPKLVQFLFRRFVSLNFVICQQLSPGHAVHLSRTADCPSARLSKSAPLPPLSCGIHPLSSLSHLLHGRGAFRLFAELALGLPLP